MGFLNWVFFFWEGIFPFPFPFCFCHLQLQLWGLREGMDGMYVRKVCMGKGIGMGMGRGVKANQLRYLLRRFGQFTMNINMEFRLWVIHSINCPGWVFFFSFS